MQLGATPSIRYEGTLRREAAVRGTEQYCGTLQQYQQQQQPQLPLVAGVYHTHTYSGIAVATGSRAAPSGAVDVHPKPVPVTELRSASARNSGHTVGGTEAGSTPTVVRSCYPFLLLLLLVLLQTVLCAYWEKGACKHGEDCQFAHGADELQQAAEGAAGPLAVRRAKVRRL